MKPTLPTLLPLLLISHAAAAPLSATHDTRSPKTGDEDSANFFVTACAEKVGGDDAWGGKSGCRAAKFSPGKCAGLGDLDNKMSAVDPRGFDCTFYVEPGCPRGSKSLAVRKPNKNLFDNSGMDDVFSGFLCWR